MSEAEVATVSVASDEWEELRTQARAAVAEMGTGVAAAAREASISYATLHAWLNRTYKGRNDNVAEQVKRWLDTRLERVRAVSSLPKAPPFIETTSARSFLQLFAHAHHAPDMALIYGGPGVGKTISVDAYKSRNTGVIKLTGQPASSSPRALLEDLAEELGIDDRSSSQRISRAIIRRLLGSGMLLIYDEAQHMSTPGLDQLRTIFDRAGIGVVLVGNETVLSRLEGVGRTQAYAQLFSRIGMRVPRPRPVTSDIDALLDAWEITGERERKVCHSIAKRPGALRALTKVLRQAKMASQLDGTGELTVQHVHDAYARLSSADLSKEEAA